MRRYPISKSAMQLAQVLGLSLARIASRAGLPGDFFASEPRDVTASQFFAIWGAMEAEADDPDFAYSIALKMARGPFVPALFSFSCSSNIELGLSRLARFKPLVAPIELSVTKSDSGVSLVIAPVSGGVTPPPSFPCFELVYFLECCRSFTAWPIVPLRATMPGASRLTKAALHYMQCQVQDAREISMTLSHQDAQRPLISENPQLWASFEPELQRQLHATRQERSLSERVRDALLELLPSGRASAEAVAAHLLTSKRSLQRKLQAEGSSFQALRDSTRSELALHYLRQEDLSIEEISYLLAYRDPNSFYRAFHNWTGMTPMDARSVSLP